MISTLAAGLAGLMALGTPIAIVLVAVTTFALAVHTRTPLQAIPEQLFNALDSFVLLAVPFFILAGAIMTRGSIARKLVAFVNALVGWMPGGLAVAGVLACVFFAAISGSGMATVAAIGSIMIPALVEAGYGKRYAIGLITTAGSLGIVIPPSIPMILYCLAMNTSIAEMFMAGIVPGLLVGAVLIAYTLAVAQKHGWKSHSRPSWREVMQTGRDGIWAILLPVLVLGGIYSGVFTATEASAVSVVYAVLVELFVYRECRLRDLPDACLDAAVLSACILFLLAGALTFNWLLTAEQIPQRVAEFLTQHIESRWAFLLIVNILLLLLGFFMDTVSAVLILGPMLTKALETYGIDFVHFGVVMVLNMEFGMLTPPFGLNLFVSMGITREPLGVVGRSVAPFLVLLLLCLLAVTYVPALSLALPEMFLR